MADDIVFFNWGPKGRPSSKERFSYLRSALERDGFVLAPEPPELTLTPGRWATGGVVAPGVLHMIGERVCTCVIPRSVAARMGLRRG